METVRPVVLTRTSDTFPPQPLQLRMRHPYSALDDRTTNNPLTKPAKRKQSKALGGGVYLTATWERCVIEQRANISRIGGERSVKQAIQRIKSIFRYKGLLSGNHRNRALIGVIQNKPKNGGCPGALASIISSRICPSFDGSVCAGCRSLRCAGHPT